MTTNQAAQKFILKLRAISGGLNFETIKHGLKAMGYEIEMQPSIDGFNFYTNAISTRLLHINSLEKGLDLTLPSYSCTEDWELLRDWVLVFLTFHTAIIIAENDLVEDMEDYLSAEKIKNQQKQYESLLNQAMRSDEPIHFHSVHRDFYAGTKIFERIRDQQESEQINFFYELIRKSQYTTLNAVNSHIVKMDQALSTTFSVLDNKENIVLQPADMIRVQVNAADHFFISYSSIDKLIRHGWHYLDEKQIYIPLMPANDWENFCELAAEMSINTALFAKYIEGEDEDGEE